MNILNYCTTVVYIYIHASYKEIEMIEFPIFIYSIYINELSSRLIIVSIGAIICRALWFRRILIYIALHTL